MLWYYHNFISKKYPTFVFNMLCFNFWIFTPILLNKFIKGDDFESASYC